MGKKNNPFITEKSSGYRPSAPIQKPLRSWRKRQRRLLIHANHRGVPVLLSSELSCLKPFRFTHFQKKVGWTPCFAPDADLGSRALYASPDSIGTNHKS